MTTCTSTTHLLIDLQIPYIYTYARKTADTGITFLYPMYYDYPGKNYITELNSELICLFQSLTRLIRSAINTCSANSCWSALS